MEINYKVLNVEDVINVNKQFLPENLFEGRSKGQLYKAYDIDSGEMTNIGKYVFFIELYLYYDENLVNALLRLSPAPFDNSEEINVYLGDVSRTDYNVKEVQKDSSLNYEYHLLIDVNSKHFERGMKEVRQSPFYIGEYIYKDISTDKIVVLIRSMCRRHIDLCIQGKFSEIFSENNYEILTSRLRLVTMYFDLDFRDKKYYFNDVSAVLCGVKILPAPENKASELIARLGIDCQKTIDVLYERYGYSEPEVLK